MADEKQIDVRSAIQKLRDAEKALAEAHASFMVEDPSDDFGLTGFTLDIYARVRDVIERIDAGEI